jgi:uncharacterized protein with von Willebrand factor type A (vWA) domain
MFWRFTKASPKDAILRIWRRVLAALAGDVEEALEAMRLIGDRYGLWRPDFTFEDFRRLVLESGEAARDARGALRLTPRGERALRRQMLQEVFPKLSRRARGDHHVRRGGGAGDPTEETRAWEFGDAHDALDPHRTLSNWARRTGGGGDVAEEDLEVRNREASTSCATALLIDVSHSMTLYGEDRMTPARRVAMAMAELILSKFPKDTLDVILFGDDAEAVPLERLPYITNGPYHTNTCAGLRLAQETLRRRKSPNRQIVLVTDGKPTAIREDGRLYKNPFELDPRVVARTLEEAASCRKHGIPITTFMMTSDPWLRRFVETFTDVNRGRAYLAGSARLESFVLVDFLKNRRRRVR